MTLMIVAISILGVLILAALLKGIITLLWAKSSEGETWSRGRGLGWW